MIISKSEIKDKVLVKIQSQGFHAYFVGGCVRDSLWHKESNDFDITTDATPDDLHKIFNNFSKIKSEKFGVTMPIIDFNNTSDKIEIATMRRDITSGRHPEVCFTKDINDDAKRRDFTINALYEDIDGNIVDPTGFGLDDIKTKSLRFVGNIKDRLNEDNLRAFRLVRFLSTKDLKFVGDMDLLKSVCSTLDFVDVSKERALSEIQKILGGKNFMCDNVQEMMDICGIYKYMGLDEIFKDMSDSKQNPDYHKEGNVLNHTKLVMKEMANQEHDWIDMLAAILHDIGKPESGRQLGTKEGCDFPKTYSHDTIGAGIVDDFCKNLCMSKDDIDIVHYLVLNHMKAHILGEYKSKFKIWKFISNENFPRLLKLTRADEKGSIRADGVKIQSIDDVLLGKDVQALLVPKTMPEPIVKGDDLINLGYKPSEKFKKFLARAYESQINDNISDKNVLLKKFKQILE